MYMSTSIAAIILAYCATLGVRAVPVPEGGLPASMSTNIPTGIPTGLPSDLPSGASGFALPTDSFPGAGNFHGGQGGFAAKGNQAESTSGPVLPQSTSVAAVKVRNYVQSDSGNGQYTLSTAAAAGATEGAGETYTPAVTTPAGAGATLPAGSNFPNLPSGASTMPHGPQGTGGAGHGGECGGHGGFDGFGKLMEKMPDSLKSQFHSFAQANSMTGMPQPTGAAGQYTRGGPGGPEVPASTAGGAQGQYTAATVTTPAAGGATETPGAGTYTLQGAGTYSLAGQ